MFRSNHQTAASNDQPRIPGMLEEDIKSFAKFNSENIIDQLDVTSR